MNKNKQVKKSDFAIVRMGNEVLKIGDEVTPTRFMENDILERGERAIILQIYNTRETAVNGDIVHSAYATLDILPLRGYGSFQGTSYDLNSLTVVSGEKREVYDIL